LHRCGDEMFRIDLCVYRIKVKTARKCCGLAGIV
jgi:hypothetical protein